MKNKSKIAKEKILSLLPHREPFLFVDEIEEVIPGEKAIGIKKFKSDEMFFNTSNSNNLTIPEAYIIEATAQVSAFILLTVNKYSNSFGLLASVQDFKFFNKVNLNETLRIIANLIGLKLGVAKSLVEVFVNNKLVAKGTIAVKIIEGG